MSKSFKAILVSDVQYRDFFGEVHTEKTGTPVVITRLMSKDWVAMDTMGRASTCEPDTFIATSGKISFIVKPLQFQKAA